MITMIMISLVVNTNCMIRIEGGSATEALDRVLRHELSRVELVTRVMDRVLRNGSCVMDRVLHHGSSLGTWIESCDTSHVRLVRKGLDSAGPWTLS